MKGISIFESHLPLYKNYNQALELSPILFPCNKIEKYYKDLSFQKKGTPM